MARLHIRIADYQAAAQQQNVPKCGNIPTRGSSVFNPLTPNDPYRGRTAPLTSKRCILYIYSTNIGTEYFKHGVYSPFFFLSPTRSLFHNSNLFGSRIIHI